MISVKSREEIEIMRRANLIVANVLKELKLMAKPGVNTATLDCRAEEIIRDSGATPAFKGYGGFPASICVSINDEVVHGIPSKRRVLKDGDIVGIDCGTCLEGYYGDAAVTVPVGKISAEAEKLLRETEASLDIAIEMARPGNRLSDISHAVQKYVEARGYSVVRNFVGHGIGKSLHEEPQVPNYGPPGRGVRLKAGMVLAIEPMINAGAYGVNVLEDGWTAVTEDGSLSAHFEHSVAITEDGPYVLSRS